HQFINERAAGMLGLLEGRALCQAHNVLDTLGDWNASSIEDDCAKGGGVPANPKEPLHRAVVSSVATLDFAARYGSLFEAAPLHQDILAEVHRRTDSYA